MLRPQRESFEDQQIERSRQDAGAFRHFFS